MKLTSKFVFDALMQSPDGLNHKTKRVIWNEPGNDITGIVARSQKIAGTAEKVAT